MSTPDITLNLALALNVPPEEILGYKHYQRKGYTVIMRDYRKFTGIQPATDEELTASVSASVSVSDHYPEGMPDDLKPTFDNPHRAKVQELKNLAYFLEIRDASALRKPALIQEIKTWQTQDEEE